jgi:hypothetical protein
MMGAVEIKKMNPVRASILNGIKNLIGDLKDYTEGLPFGGMNEGTPPREKKAVKYNNYTGKWPGVMRGYGPITRLCDWEKEDIK